MSSLEVKHGPTTGESIAELREVIVNHPMLIADLRAARAEIAELRERIEFLDKHNQQLRDYYRGIKL